MEKRNGKRHYNYKLRVEIEPETDGISEAVMLLKQIDYIIPEMRINHQVQINKFIKKYSANDTPKR